MSSDAFFGPDKIIVIFDTEWTTWEGAQERNWSGEGEHRELVQIAAQMINLEERKVLNSFNQIVKPRLNPTLSRFFIDLTGITQKEVDSNGLDFEGVYESFMDWSQTFTIYSYNKKVENTDGLVLKENIELYGSEIFYPAERFRNVAPFFAENGIDISQFNSGKLYKAFNLSLSGQEHNAMHDVNSIVESLFHLMRK